MNGYNNDHAELDAASFPAAGTSNLNSPQQKKRGANSQHHARHSVSSALAYGAAASTSSSSGGSSAQHIGRPRRGSVRTQGSSSQLHAGSSNRYDSHSPAHSPILEQPSEDDYDDNTRTPAVGPSVDRSYNTHRAYGSHSMNGYRPTPHNPMSSKPHESFWKASTSPLLAFLSPNLDRGRGRDRDDDDKDRYPRSRSWTTQVALRWRRLGRIAQLALLAFVVLSCIWGFRWRYPPKRKTKWKPAIPKEIWHGGQLLTLQLVL